MACKPSSSANLLSTMRSWTIAERSSPLIVAEPRTPALNGATQAGLHLEMAVRDYVFAYAWLHGRRKATEHLGVSRHTLWAEMALAAYNLVRMAKRMPASSSLPAAVSAG